MHASQWMNFQRYHSVLRGSLVTPYVKLTYTCRSSELRFISFPLLIPNVYSRRFRIVIDIPEQWRISISSDRDTREDLLGVC